VSGSGLWHYQMRGSRTSLLSATLAVAMFALAIACGTTATPSTPKPAPAVVEVATALPVPVVRPPTLQPANGASVTPATTAGGLPAIQSVTYLPSIANLVDKVNPAVASISVESVSRGLFFDFTDQGAGSGIVLSPEGHVVTNWHVIQDVRGIRVNLPNGKTYAATIIGGDIVTDLAVIKIEPDEPLMPAEFGNSAGVKVGDWVVAVGNALALKGGPTVTMGIISAKGRTVRTERGDLYDMFQTDAAINDGNSGGPLVNLEGKVIGISTAMLKEAQGIGFAISSNAAVPIIESLIEHGRVMRPLIGLSGTDVTPAIANRFNYNVDDGVVVTRLGRGGPADVAGLAVGDVITKLDGIPTPDMARFLTLLWSYSAGDTIQIEFLRENRLGEANVTLVERP